MRKKFLLMMLTLLFVAMGSSGKLFAQQLLVNCDYNSSTEGYGVTKFSNYAGAYAYATANAKTATIVIEKTNTLSGNTFDNNHKNYSKLAVVIKDGATMGNAASKWDMTYPVTVEPGGTLACARPKNASVSNIHIKNKLIVGAKGATKKAYVNFLSDSYQDCDISIRYNGSIEVYNADFYIQDLDAQGKLTIEDSEVYVDGAFASATSSFYSTTLTNSTITINGTQIEGGLSDFAGGTSNQLGNVNINNSTLTINEGNTIVAANVTATNSAIAVNNLTVKSGKTLNLNDGSTLDAENIDGTGYVKIDGVAAPIIDGAMYVPVSEFAALKAAVEAGNNVQLTTDITTTSAIVTSGVTSVIDLNNTTLTIGAGDNKFNDESNITIKNGTVNINGITVNGNAIFCLDEYEKNLVSTLTFDEVNLTGENYSSAYGVFYIGESSVLNVNGGVWNLLNDEHEAGGVFKADASGAKLNIDGLNLTAHNVRRVVTHANTTIENSTMTISGDAEGVDAEMEHGFNRSPLAISNSTITMKDMVGRGITAQNGAVTISGNSNVNITNCIEATIDVRNNQTVTIDNTSTVFVDKEPTLANGCTINGTVKLPTVAKIGAEEYSYLADALNAAKSMTGDVTVEICAKVTMNQALTGDYTSIKFVGPQTRNNSEAEIYLDVQGYITATGKKVAFENLKLSKSEGGFIANAGFMNVAFGIFDVAEVSYTDCTFLNGAYASSGKVTYTGCTFMRSWDKYGLWAYGNADITVAGCTFADYRGIKMYAENGANESTEKPNLTVKNTNFSAVNNKPAIVLTYGESVALEENTYSSTGVFELDLDGAPNGVAVTSDVAPTCINDNGACGVLVDGKIYTTVEQAAKVATSGSTVTLLHNSAETVALPMGVILDKNGFEATGVTVLQPGDVEKSGTWGGIDWTLTYGGTLTIKPTAGEPVPDANAASRTYDVGEWREAVRYNSKGEGVAVEGWPYDRLKVKTLVIEEGVISIGSFTAQSFTNLTGEVVIPSTVKYIGQEAFQKSTMTKLTFAPVPAGETGEELCIAQGAFKNLIIEEVSLPADRPVHLHAWVFNNCHNLKNVYMPATIVSVHGTNHIDYHKDFNAHSNPTWTKASEIFAYNENMETVTFGSEEVMGMFYANNNGTNKDYFKANVGLVTYCDVQDAIAAAAESGNPISLIKNTNTGSEDNKLEIPAGETIIIDLKGKEMTGSILAPNANLTVKNGTIKNTNKDVSAIEINKGTLTIENVNINSARHALRIDGEVTATINGGTYKSAQGTGTGTYHAANISGNANVTINGGTFVGPNGNATTTADSGSAINVQSGASVIINNGTYKGGKTKTLFSEGTLVLYGGKYDQDPTAFVVENYMAEQNAEGLFEVVKTIAMIGETPYASLQAAIDAVQNGETITLINNVTENVELTEKVGLYYTINGDGKTMNGKINIIPLSDENDNRRITIKGINFVNTADAAVDFISCVVTNHYPRLTVEGCTFTGNGKNTDVALRLKTAYGAVIKNCTGTGLHSFLQNTAGKNLTIEGVTVTNSKGAFALGTVQGVTVKGSTIDVATYGIRIDANTYNNNAVIESNTVKAFIPVVVRNANAESNIEVKGTNNFTATNTDNLWMAIGTSEYETNGQMPTAATGKVRVTLNDANLSKDGVYGDYVPVAKIGETEYTTLEAAFKAATSGCEIVILENVTVDYAWDARNTGAKFTVPVTINGNGKTIKFAAEIKDNNWNTVFRFEENATVKDLTVDIANATGAQRVISAKKSLNVDGLNIVGSARYGIIFGEGASATDLAATEIVVKNSTLNGTRRAISDNEGGKDVKSVEITENTLNANAYISASESIVFSNNTAKGEVDLRSYAADNVLSVVAKDNALNEDVKNYIYAKTIDAQEEFETKNPPLKVSTKAELDAALAAAQDGDIIVMTADIDYGTSYTTINKAITLDLGGKILTTSMSHGSIRLNGGCTLKNGTLNHNGGVAALKVWDAAAIENLVINVAYRQGSTIGGIVIQENAKGVASIKNVTIQGEGLTNGIETYNCGDATENVIGAMENVTIDAVRTGMLISAPCGTATNCNIKGGVNGIEIWIKGTYSASLNLVDCDVEGGVYAHDEFSSNPDIVNNGTLSLTTEGNTTGAGIKDVTLTIARAENLGGVIEEVMDAAQAKIDDTYYITIAKAIEAAKAGETVTVLEGTYAVPTMKAGIAIVGEGNVVFEGTLSGTLENLTMKNIHIKGGDAQRWAYAKGDLVFENVIFEATSIYALHFDGITAGTKLTYKDCTIIGWAAMGGSPASCTFEGCTFEGNGTYGLIRTYFDATITDCTFDVANVNTTDVYQDGIHAVSGATVTVNNCTNVNGDMKNVVNVGDTSVVVLDGVEIKNVAKVGDNYYLTLQGAFEAIGNGAGKTVELLCDIDLASAEWTPVNFNGVFDGQDHTISNLVINGGSNSDQGFFGRTNDGEIKNVTFNNAKVSGRLNVGVVAGTPYTSKYTNITVTGHVEVNGMAYVGGVGGKNAYADWTNITVNVDETSYVNANSVENGTAYRTYVGGVIGFNGEGGHTFKNITSNIKVIGSTQDIGGVFGIAHYSNKFENITFKGAVEAPAGAEEVGGIAGVWHNEKGYTVTFTNCTSTGTVKVGDVITTDYSIVGGAYNAANETSENSGSLIINGVEAWLKVAETNGVKYLTLAEAAAAAQSGDTIIILDNLTIGSSSLTLPAGITLDGNGKTIEGGITAGGDLTFVGHTKVSTFNAGYYDRTITIGEDACLEVTGGRMTVSYGNTINVTGSIDEAKSANKAEITPSLIIEQGLSFNGDGRGVEFNITNAYVKLGDSSSKNNGATGKFNFNFVNSIVDFTKTLKTYEPKKEGLDPSFEINVENSVVSFASHLELWNTNTALTLNNSNLTVGSSFANAGTINVTNGANFVVNAPIMSSHGGNTGTINIKGGVFELKDSNQDWENAGTIKVNAVGGKLITNDFKCVGEGKIVVDAENLIGTVTVVDGNGVYNFANITEIINGESVNVSYENGDVTVTKVLATIDENEYQDLQEAIEAAGITETTITIMASFSTDDSYTIDAGQNITLDLNGKTITGTDKTEKSFGLINNNGTLTIVDNSNNRAQGALKLSATVNSGWSRYSSVISNQPGGKLTVNGGTIEHLGGTDMAYGIDNLTNGKGTYAETVVNGGTVKSTYRAIRQFLNGIEAQNILTVNGGTIEGANKSIWMQDPSKNANTGTLIVNANANLYGDVYLSVTEGSTEWPVEVAIVESAIKQGTVLTSNVPEGYLLVAENGLYTVETIKVKEQTFNLNNGWTWISLCVDATAQEDLASFEAQLAQYNTDNQIVQIKNQTKAATYQKYYENYGWYGNLKSLAVNDMYMVKIEKDNVVVKLEDYKVNPADYTFNLVSGWTWLGFPSVSDNPIALEEALKNITPNKGDQIKSQEGFATYMNNKWYGNLYNMTSGKGYMYRNTSGETVELVYPAEVNYRGVAPANITAANNLMVPNMSKYANNMSIIAVVNIDGEELMTEDFEVAAFAGEELRGSARPIYLEDFNRYMLFMTVYGEANEELTFKYYDLNSGEELNLFADSKVVFEINATVGSIEEALVLNYGTLSIDENSLNGFNVYPNPVNRENAISFETTFDKVEVYNSLGVVVAEYANVDKIDGIETAGIYVIKVTNDNTVKYCRVIVK